MRATRLKDLKGKTIWHVSRARARNGEIGMTVQILQAARREWSMATIDAAKSTTKSTQSSARTATRKGSGVGYEHLHVVPSRDRRHHTPRLNVLRKDFTLLPCGTGHENRWGSGRPLGGRPPGLRNALRN